MNINEVMELIRYLQQLTPEKQKEFYFMVKGAAVVAESQ